MADKRNLRELEVPGSLFLNRWWTGWYTNRFAMFTPITALGIQIVQRQDALWSGHDMQLTPQFSLRRRYGFLKACTSAFGSDEWPIGFFSFQNLSGTVTPIVDTQTNVYSFTGSSKTSIYTKASGAIQSSFNSVANIMYWVDGQNANKWNGSSVTNMGIVTPASAPTVTPVGSGSLSPTVGYTWVYCYLNSSVGTLSSASPVSGNSGPLTDFNFTLGGARCTDAQCDKIQIYRTADGGALYYFVAEIDNPGSGSWTYTDSTADADLNTDIVAPMAGVNNPPPSGATLLVWYAGRLWAASGNTLYFSAGPDCTNGVGEEAWPAENNYALPGAITALNATSQGLIVFTYDDAYVVTGTSSSTFTVPQLWQVNWGVASQNCVSQDGDNLFVFTTKGQLFSYTDSAGLNEIGFMIEAQLAAINPADAYVALHRSGADEGVFVSDGSANIYRYSTVASAWDLPMQPVNGCNAIASIELSSANWRLVMGRPAGELYILERDLSTWTDDGTAYTCSAVVGSITVAPPRHTVNLASVLLQVAAVGTYPTLSVMLNEITDLGSLPATFTALPNPVPDPPQLGQSQSLWTKRHDLKAAASPLPSHVQHLQVEIAFLAEAYAGEIYGLGLYTIE